MISGGIGESSPVTVKKRGRPRKRKLDGEDGNRYFHAAFNGLRRFILTMSINRWRVNYYDMNLPYIDLIPIKLCTLNIKQHSFNQCSIFMLWDYENSILVELGYKTKEKLNSLYYD